jgi:hypothetical protein
MDRNSAISAPDSNTITVQDESEDPGFHRTYHENLLRINAWYGVIYRWALALNYRTRHQHWVTRVENFWKAGIKVRRGRLQIDPERPRKTDWSKREVREMRYFDRSWKDWGRDFGGSRG